MQPQPNETTEHPRVKPPILVRYGKIAEVSRVHGFTEAVRAELTHLCETAADRETDQIAFWHPINCLTKEERRATHAAGDVADALRDAGYLVRKQADGWLTILDLSEFCR